ncbi:MAG: DUF2927 domain-containing protein [Rhodobacteraceae bacterium]|nr:DUF2927 domain-containing protein [Alphaproteobacteria bacterium]NNK65714.1 DUF2927 domain-containing protein [Paracoccaceae bacterium]
MRTLAVLATLALGACSTAIAPPDVTDRRTPQSLPPMKTFGEARVTQPTRSNRSIAADILDLTFTLESGRALPVLTRFEGPITVRVLGEAPRSLSPDLDQLITRLRREAGIDISRVSADQPASVTIEVLTRRELQRAVPQAACFVAPRLTSWNDFRANRRSSALDWTTLKTRQRMAIFLPGDVPPQEVRDCLHEELAQAIGPLNDLYRLSDSVFNDDNFHTVLTGFDMLTLRVIYARELRSGMTRDEVAARLPAILARLNPRGQRGGALVASDTPRAWVNTMEAALDPRSSPLRRRTAARDAVEYALEQGWEDNRLGYSLYALGRLSIGTQPELAVAAFLQAGSLYSTDDGTALQEAHVATQLAAFALTAGQSDIALEIVDRNLAAVSRAQKADLLATLLLIKAEALELEGRRTEAEAVRLDSLGWARYGFGSDREVRALAAEIAALSPRNRQGGGA